MALRQLGDYGRAEDATQETFAAVWRSAKSYRAERGSASAWLYAVARHAIIDRARQRVEPVGGDSRDRLRRGGPGGAGRVDVALLARARRRSSGCPSASDVVLELAYWSGLSQTEVASYLDVPLGTVKTRTRAGLARLARCSTSVRE